MDGEKDTVPLTRVDIFELETFSPSFLHHHQAVNIFLVDFFRPLQVYARFVVSSISRLVCFRSVKTIFSFFLRKTLLCRRLETR